VATDNQQDSTKYTRAQILDKIRKLMAMANNEGATETVAALYASKAQDLMQRWAIEESEASASSGAEMKFVIQEVKFYQDTKEFPWESALAKIVSDAFFTHSVRFRKDHLYRFVGRESDVEIAAYMFSQLTYTLEEMGRAAFKTYAARYARETSKSIYKVKNAPQYRAKWIDSWTDGALRTLRTRLEATTSKFKESSSQALVLVETRKAEAYAHADNLYRLVPGKLSKRTVLEQARAQGRRDGANINIRQGIAQEERLELE
jgi:hypothetical protein